ncbi:hypothetical protein BLNAU_17080 [Blattamonas nauphoetae]|uniref:Uncharacterized protein n=1 Tax=Blattamonas nauphoetae TaxID=2049346 RepID=A0ABQ9X7Q5_9EUKA|nr:hypothetical protein BLNAU_17080 [Blattamonas nauphoetae]
MTTKVRFTIKNDHHRRYAALVFNRDLYEQIQNGLPMNTLKNLPGAFALTPFESTTAYFVFPTNSDHLVAFIDNETLANLTDLAPFCTRLIIASDFANRVANIHINPNTTATITKLTTQTSSRPGSSNWTMEDQQYESLSATSLDKTSFAVFPQFSPKANLRFDQSLQLDTVEPQSFISLSDKENSGPAQKNSPPSSKDSNTHHITSTGDKKSSQQIPPSKPKNASKNSPPHKNTQQHAPSPKNVGSGGDSSSDSEDSESDSSSSDAFFAPNIDHIRTMNKATSRAAPVDRVTHHQSPPVVKKETTPIPIYEEKRISSEELFRRQLELEAQKQKELDELIQREAEEKRRREEEQKRKLEEAERMKELEEKLRVEIEEKLRKEMEEKLKQERELAKRKEQETRRIREWRQRIEEEERQKTLENQKAEDELRMAQLRLLHEEERRKKEEERQREADVKRRKDEIKRQREEQRKKDEEERIQRENTRNKKLPTTYKTFVPTFKIPGAISPNPNVAPMLPRPFTVTSTGGMPINPTPFHPSKPASSKEPNQAITPTSSPPTGDGAMSPTSPKPDTLNTPAESPRASTTPTSPRSSPTMSDSQNTSPAPKSSDSVNRTSLPANKSSGPLYSTPPVQAKPMLDRPIMKPTPYTNGKPRDYDDDHKEDEREERYEEGRRGRYTTRYTPRRGGRESRFQYSNRGRGRNPDNHSHWEPRKSGEGDWKDGNRSSDDIRRGGRPEDRSREGSLADEQREEDEKDSAFRSLKSDEERSTRSEDSINWNDDDIIHSRRTGNNPNLPFFHRAKETSEPPPKQAPLFESPVSIIPLKSVSVGRKWMPPRDEYEDLDEDLDEEEKLVRAKARYEELERVVRLKKEEKALREQIEERRRLDELKRIEEQKRWELEQQKFRKDFDGLNDDPSSPSS